MENSKNNLTDTQRITALENHLRTIESQLSDIRNVISGGYDVLSKCNDSRARAIADLQSDVDEMQRHLIPTFYKVFPRQGEFLDEIDGIFQGKSKRK